MLAILALREVAGLREDWGESVRKGVKAYEYGHYHATPREPMTPVELERRADAVMAKVDEHDLL